MEDKTFAMKKVVTLLVSDDLLNKVNEKVPENHGFTMSELFEHSSEVSRSLLHERVSEKLGYYKFCACWVPKMLMYYHKSKRMSLAIVFLFFCMTWKEQIF